MEYYNRHYITTGPGGLITDGWSDGPHQGRDTSGAICSKRWSYWNGIQTKER